MFLSLEIICSLKLNKNVFREDKIWEALMTTRNVGTGTDAAMLVVQIDRWTPVNALISLNRPYLLSIRNIPAIKVSFIPMLSGNFLHRHVIHFIHSMTDI